MSQVREEKVREYVEMMKDQINLRFKTNRNSSDSLISLSLVKKNIDNEGIICLAEALKRNQTLTKLKLVYNLLILFFTSISLCYNKIGTEGVASIGEALKENHTLIKLQSVPLY